MNECLKNIVTISDGCRVGNWLPSTSGYDLMRAPEISINNLASMANENYVSGMAMLRSIMDQALVEVSNDFIAVLNTNQVATNIVQRSYRTSDFIPGVSMGTSPQERGITLYKSKKIRGNLRKPKITSIDIYPLEDVAETWLNIYDAGKRYGYKISLVANQINTFNLEHIMKGKFARVVLSNVEVASSFVECGEGCNGREPNDCAYATGFDGFGDTRNKQGFGINVNFTCMCDYEQLLCDLSKTYVGKIIYLKARAMVLEAQIKTNRLNNWVIYNREETIKQQSALEAEYTDTWNALVAGLYGILKNYRDECIICRGIQWKVNA